MVPESKPKTDKQSILQYLEEITKGWDDLDEVASIEMRCLMPNRTPHVARYAPDMGGIEMLADDALEFNRTGLNCYVVVNPVRKSAPLRRNGKMSGAEDGDIIASFFFWADGDDENAAVNIKNFAGPKWTMAVTTGRTPSPRPHIYWRCEDGPIYNLEAWTQVQKAIAARLSTDPSVVNPARIMRLPGTVNWPTEKKAAKGRVAEMATLRTQYDDDRDPVPFEQMRRVFNSDSQAATQPATGALQIDTGPQPLDRALAAASIMAGTDWRENVKKLVASYVARGWTDDEIVGRCLAFTLPGWTPEETAEDVAAFIKWTREQEARSGGQYAVSPETNGDDHQFREMTDEEKDAVEPMLFEPWGSRDLAAIPYPEFVYSDFYARGYTSVTLAPPKVGKSMLGLAEALDMASGAGFLTGDQRDKMRVVYYNAEDDQNVIDSRVAALLGFYNIDQTEIAETLFPVSGVERDDFFMISGQDGVINERLFVALEKFIEAQRADVLIFDPLQDLSHSPETNEVFRLLGQRLRRMAAKTGVALGLIHHTRKIAPGQTATIEDGRGGSALRGTARFNRLLVSMTEDEAAKAGVENHRHFMRIGDIESNLAPPSSDVNRWFEKISVTIPNGRDVGAIRTWNWPDAFDGITRQHAGRVRALVDQSLTPPRYDIRASAWVGELVADATGLNLTDKNHKARIKTIVDKWIESDVLRVTEEEDKRAGRTRKVVICGSNDPLQEAR